ncbi:hypothetical protein DFH09DRAFT_9186 [Mycena vulgaris]|nr:hypothetical protein DFH09DRAFT_9186 [Mycena vulgaris]
MFSKFTFLACLFLAVISIARSTMIDAMVGGLGVLSYIPNSVNAGASNGVVIQFTLKQQTHTISPIHSNQLFSVTVHPQP